MCDINCKHFKGLENGKLNDIWRKRQRKMSRRGKVWRKRIYERARPTGKEKLETRF